MRQSQAPTAARCTPTALTRREIASGSGWHVTDVAYTAGPEGRPLRDQHGFVSIAAIVAGSFRYRSTHGAALMSPGALLLGNAGGAYECGFEPSGGDRCISFAYTPEHFEEIAKAVPTATATQFRVHRIPPGPAILPLAARAEVYSAAQENGRWEELSLLIAGEVLGLLSGHAHADRPPSRRDARRVADALQVIEARYVEPLSIAELAGVACMSPYHFMRTFRQVVGVTAYQYLLQTRLRHAAVALGTTREPVSAIAFDAGFGDLSTFAETFRRVFGLTPGQYRIAAGADMKVLTSAYPPPTRRRQRCA